MLLWVQLALAAGPTEGRWVARCDPAGPEAVEARAAIDGLDPWIRAMEPWDPVTEELEEAWEALVGLPCMDQARMGPGMPRLAQSSARPIRDWWLRGGEEWLRGFTVEDVRDGRLHVRFPPSLGTPMAADHRLAVLMCQPLDRGCIEPTEGFRERAEGAIEEGERRGDAKWLGVKCAEEMAGEPDDQRFLSWLRCVDGRQPQHWTLPVESLRVPERGVLAVAGSRLYKHHTWCEEVRTYDLETGAVWFVRRCKGRFGVGLPPTIHVEVGRVPVGALREAAWMIVSLDAVRWGSVGLKRVPVPEGVTPRWRDGGPVWGMISVGGDAVGDSSLTVAWTWTLNGAIRAEGTLTLPTNLAERHAVELLRAAEVQVERGCPPRALPGPLFPANEQDAKMHRLHHDYYKATWSGANTRYVAANLELSRGLLSQVVNGACALE